MQWVGETSKYNDGRTLHVYRIRPGDLDDSKSLPQRVHRQNPYRPASSSASSWAAVSSPVRSRTTRTRLQYSA